MLRVNGLEVFGRWGLAEYRDVYEIETRFDAIVRGFVLEANAACQ